MAMSLACSEHVSYRRVEGGGVQYNELIEVSREASMRLGVPVVASGNIEGSTNRIIRVSYELTGKLIGEITDPSAFADCCAARPDQCSQHYIGEFIEGSGSIYHQAANNVSGSGSGADPTSGVNGDLDFSHGAQWERGITFPNPVFFAFKLSETPYTQQSASSCRDFMNTLPQSDDDGIYLLAANSRPAKDEATARSRAMRSATMQAYQSFGITQDPNAPDAATLMPGLQAREWCVEKQEDRYIAKALVYAVRPPPSAAPAPADAAPPLANTQRQPRPAPAVAMPAAPSIRPPVSDQSIMAASSPAISGTAMQTLIQQLAGESFSSDKMALLGSVGAYGFTCAQVALIMNSFDFDSDKVKAVQILRSQIVDPENGWTLTSGLSFSSDQDAVRALF
jgi:hypothetical protein